MYKTFEEWIKKGCHWRRTNVFDHIKIVRALGHLSDETLRRMGHFNAILLARHVDKGNALTERLIRLGQENDNRAFHGVLRGETTGTTDPAELGERINVPGMVYAPINEQGVVYLFGLLAMKLGFEVEQVRRRFPDCEAKQGRQRFRIEFEYRSRDFEKHHHDVGGCDLIVCWEDDWGNECPVPRIDLKKEVMKLSKERPA